MLFVYCHPSSKNKFAIQFFKEEVLIKVDTDEVLVNGKYWFKNRSGAKRKMGIFYPFPIDEHHAFPYFIEVKNHSFKKVEKGIIFNIELKPYETQEIVITYKQSISINNAKYILVTARAWGKPIEKARFIVDIPQKFEANISYEPDSIVIQNDRLLCYIYEQNLLPARDLTIDWQ